MLELTVTRHPILNIVPGCRFRFLKRLKSVSVGNIKRQRSATYIQNIPDTAQERAYAKSQDRFSACLAQPKKAIFLRVYKVLQSERTEFEMNAIEVRNRSLTCQHVLTLDTSFLG